MSTYNGWRNRETWLVNIHFMDAFDGQEVSASYLENMIDEHIESHELSIFLKDMICNDSIDFESLAEAHNSYLKE